MTYEERIKSMGLKPFEKYGFLYHADVSNKSRKESLETCPREDFDFFCRDPRLRPQRV